MADNSYERQHIALQAAGYINGAGTTQLTFGCTMTRVSVGVYAMVLDASAGIVDNESFGTVTVKGTSPLSAVLQDTSNVVKTARVFNGSDVATDNDIEIILRKSVTR